MSTLRIQRMVINRRDHRVVVWGDITLVWGGVSCDTEDEWDPAVIMCHQDGIWTEKTTTGHIPPTYWDGIAEVVNNHLYLICGKYPYIVNDELYYNDVHKLDLKSWAWSKMQPTGTMPLKSGGMASWVHRDRIFLFGGYGRRREEGTWYPDSLELFGTVIQYYDTHYNNQLVYYDTETNSWNWPVSSGKIPSPRENSGALSVGETSLKSSSRSPQSLAILFGGYSMPENPSHKNDLYILNMDSMVWTEVSISANIGAWPQGRRQPSIISVSPKKAVLSGGFECDRGINLTDCWMLNIEHCMYEETGKEIWTRCGHHEDALEVSCREAILEPSSKRIWLVGGFQDFDGQPLDHIRELTFKAPPLKVLALEAVAKHYNKLSSEVNQLPEMDKLRCAIEAKASMKYKIS